MEKKNFHIFLLLLVIISFIACEQDVFVQSKDPDTSRVKISISYTEYENGKVSVITQSGQMDLLTEYDISRIQYKAECENKPNAVGTASDWIDINLSTTKLSKTLEYGTWNIYIRGLDTKGNEVLTGSTVLEVTEKEESTTILIEGQFEGKKALIAFDIATPSKNGQNIKVEYKKVNEQEWTLIDDKDFFTVFQNRKEDGETEEDWTEYINEGNHPEHVLYFEEGIYVMKISYMVFDDTISVIEIPAKKLVIKPGTIITIKGHFSEDLNQDASFSLEVRAMSHQIYAKITRLNATTFNTTYENTDISDVIYHWSVDGMDTGVTSMNFEYIPPLKNKDVVHIISVWLQAKSGGAEIIGQTYMEVKYTGQELIDLNS